MSTFYLHSLLLPYVLLLFRHFSLLHECHNDNYKRHPFVCPWSALDHSNSRLHLPVVPKETWMVRAADIVRYALTACHALRRFSHQAQCNPFTRFFSIPACVVRPIGFFVPLAHCRLRIDRKYPWLTSYLVIHLQLLHAIFIGFIWFSSCGMADVMPVFTH